MGADYASWRGRLAQANDPEFWPIEEIDRLLSEGEAQFWCDGRAALVTRIVDYPGGAVAVESLAGAGDMDALTESIAPAVEQWAKAEATHLLIIGRPGWARVHRDKWRHHQSILLRDIR